MDNQNKLENVKISPDEVTKAVRQYNIDQEVKAVLTGMKKCSVTLEYVDLDYCNSFSKGKGCRYKEACNVYKMFVEENNKNAD